ncbi:MAG: aminoacyltransferase [Erysipelotrichaceae bacterium]|nr:aminoacyltransferase [Erysipelotrichaceae bacterium]
MHGELFPADRENSIAGGIMITGNDSIREDFDMSFVFHTDCAPKDMDAFVTASDQNTLFQCSDWAKIKYNWKSILTSVTEDGEIRATALVLIRKLIPGRNLMYIPRGPVMDYTDIDLVNFYLENLTKLAKQNRCAAVRFDPAVLYRKYPYHEREAEHPVMNRSVIDMLEALGCRHKGFTVRIEEATQPRFNASMHVTADYRDHLEHKTAKCIRAAEHKGIEVKSGLGEVHNLAEAMHHTEVRKGVALRGEDYFRNMMEVYGDHAVCLSASINFPKQIEKLADAVNEAETLLESGNVSKKQRSQLTQNLEKDKKELEKLAADYAREGKDTVITSGILAVYNDRLMELFYMGNHPDYLRMYSSYLLYAKCLDICAEKGIEHCSFGGIEGTLDDGLTLFKSNWIMDVEEYIGEFNIVIDPAVYQLFDSVYPKALQAYAKLRSRK